MAYTKGHKDNVANEAIGAADREWKEMARLAVRLRERNSNPLWAAEQEKKFTGIYRRLLDDPIDEVKREAGR